MARSRNPGPYNDPRINFELNPRIDRMDYTNRAEYMQRIVDRMDPSNPLRPRLIEFYGLQDAAGPAGGGGLEGAVTTRPSGPGWSEGYTVQHGPVGTARGRPKNQEDPFYAPNQGVTDELTPWLIAPQQQAGFRGGETGIPPQERYTYGIPSSVPIARPPAQSGPGQKITPPVGNQRAGMPQMPYQRDWGPGNR